MNQKIPEELTRREPGATWRGGSRGGGGAGNNFALELSRFEISRSRDCVKRIQRTCRANAWKKAAFFLRLDSSVIACRAPSLLCPLPLPPPPSPGRPSVRSPKLARACLFICAPFVPHPRPRSYAYNRWAVRGKQGRGRRDAPNHYNRPRQ